MMITKIVCIGIGIMIGAVIVMVRVCCSEGADFMRSVERWVDEE